MLKGLHVFQEMREALEEFSILHELASTVDEQTKCLPTTHFSTSPMEKTLYLLKGPSTGKSTTIGKVILKTMTQ